MFNKLKESIAGKKIEYVTQLASFDYTQLELEYCYKKAGNTNNALVSEGVKLIDEPENKHDPKALAVYLFNVKIGYIPSSDTDMVRNFKSKENPLIRLYFFNKKYRAEITIIHR